MARVAVDSFDINSMPGNVRRTIRTTDSVIVWDASDAGRDDKRHVGELPTSVQQLQSARLHRLKAESALPATALKFAGTEVLHDKPRLLLACA
jgi:hypothetical protein